LAHILTLHLGWITVQHIGIFEPRFTAGPRLETRTKETWQIKEITTPTYLRTYSRSRPRKSRSVQDSPVTSDGEAQCFETIHEAEEHAIRVSLEAILTEEFGVILHTKAPTTGIDRNPETGFGYGGAHCIAKWLTAYYTLTPE
jgi:hypothetical protein